MIINTFSKYEIYCIILFFYKMKMTFNDCRLKLFTIWWHTIMCTCVGWTISVETLSNSLPILSFPQRHTVKGFLGTDSMTPTSSSPDQLDEEFSNTFWMLSPLDPSKVTWLKVASSMLDRPVTATTTNTGTPNQEK